MYIHGGEPLQKDRVYCACMGPWDSRIRPSAVNILNRLPEASPIDMHRLGNRIRAFTLKSTYLYLRFADILIARTKAQSKLLAMHQTLYLRLAALRLLVSRNGLIIASVCRSS